jgi:mediator of RNA polymerase II transcription subunit 14
MPALRVHLCGDEVVIITIDPRTGRLNLRDTGDLAAAGRVPKLMAISDKLVENPAFVLDALVGLRLGVSASAYIICLLKALLRSL